SRFIGTSSTAQMIRICLRSGRRSWSGSAVTFARKYTDTPATTSRTINGCSMHTGQVTRLLQSRPWKSISGESRVILPPAHITGRATPQAALVREVVRCSVAPNVALAKPRSHRMIALQRFGDWNGQWFDNVPVWSEWIAEHKRHRDASHVE